MSDSNPAPAHDDFARLPLGDAVLANLKRLGYHRMTPVQAAALPLALAGHDLIAQAKTGSGKTAAFALALLARLTPHVSGQPAAVQALVLCPTRELAEQVTLEVRRLARAEDNTKVLTLCGGAPLKPQADSLAHGADVVVGTPGRIIDHLDRQTLSLAGLNTLVLDEADRMLDMGFGEDIGQVIAQAPKNRQTLLFSATYPEGVKTLATRFMRAPQEVTLSARPDSSLIRQRFYEVTEAQRLPAVVQLLSHHRPERTLAFCSTRAQCRELTALLQAQGWAALALHGELEQRERDQVLIQFGNRSASVLVATDVAARGIDIAGLEAVINVDISPDPAQHTHRVGRTGRTGPQGDVPGWAFSLASLDEMDRVGRIDEVQGRDSEWHAIADVAGSASRKPPKPPMVTLQLLGGRKDKIRAGDVLGALTKDLGLPGTQIGKININEFSTYVAVAREAADTALRGLNAGKVKGKSVKARLL